MSEKTTSAAMYTMVLCALLLTGMTANREFNSKLASTNGVAIKDWQSYAKNGNAVGGTRDALTLVIFSDYECPFCRSLNAQVDSLIIRRPQTRIVIRNFPLPGHPQAMPAARASVCAAEQNKFWEYNDALFAAAARSELRGYDGIASALHLNAEIFQACMASNRPDRIIEQDVAAGKRLGVEGTPGLLLNEKLYRGLPNDLDALVGRTRIVHAIASRLGRR
jgi:protein-disulfide isomerase